MNAHVASRFFPVLALILAPLASLHCGSDATPLGGPFGGTTNDSPPANPSAGDDDGSQVPTGDSQLDAGRSTPNPGEDAGSSVAPAVEAGSPLHDEAGALVDAGRPDASVVDSAVPPAAVTWTSIYDAYLVPPTIGNCPSCHAEMADAKGSYAWLDQRGDLKSLNDKDSSILSWYGGDMPKHGPTSEPEASADIDAWAAAGYPND